MDAENKENYFPWMEEVVHSFAKYFMIDYDINVLSFLHRNIDEEIRLISSGNGYIVTRSKVLYRELTHIYEHMRLKMSQNSSFPNTILSCVKLLSQLIRIGLILTQGLTDSEWIERIMTAIKLFSGKKAGIYDALLLVNGLKKIHFKPYALILKCILEDYNDDATEPLIYMEIILLYRRLKALSPNKNKVLCDVLVTKIKPPANLISWLKSLNVDEPFFLPKNLQYKKVALHLMRRNLSKSLLKNIRDMVLNHYYLEDDSNKFTSRYEEDQTFETFVIDTSSNIERDVQIRIHSSGNANSHPKRKRKKPGSLPKSDIEDIEVKKNSKEVAFMDSHSNLMDKNGMQLARKKQSDIDIITLTDSDPEITTCPTSNDRKISSKKKKKKPHHRKTAGNNELEAISVKSPFDSDSAFCQNDLLLKRSKQIHENITTASPSPKRSMNEDTDNAKDMFEKETSPKAKKKLKLLRDSDKFNECISNEIYKESNDIIPLRLLVDKNKTCTVDFQNNLSSNTNINYDETSNNKSDEGLSRTKNHTDSSSTSPSSYKELNNDRSSNDKHMYFKKLMLRKLSSEPCIQDVNVSKVCNSNMPFKETNHQINEVANTTNSSKNTVVSYGKEQKLVSDDNNEDETVSVDNTVSNVPFKNKEFSNNFSENVKINEDINHNNISESIKLDHSAVLDTSSKRKEKDILCKVTESPVAEKPQSSNKLEADERINSNASNYNELSDSTPKKLTSGSVLSEKPPSLKKFLHLDCSVSSPEKTGWDRMKVCVDGTESKIKIDIDIKMNMESLQCMTDSKCTHISIVEQKFPGNAMEDAIEKKTSISSENVCETKPSQLSNLELKLPVESFSESKAKAADKSSEKEPDDESKSTELSNLDETYSKSTHMSIVEQKFSESVTENAIDKKTSISSENSVCESTPSQLSNSELKLPVESSSDSIAKAVDKSSKKELNDASESTELCNLNKNDSQSTLISIIEQKFTESTMEASIEEKTSISSGDSVYKSKPTQLSNLEVKLPVESTSESEAKTADKSSEKEPDYESKSIELSNLDDKIQVECSSETNKDKTVVSSNGGPTVESEFTLSHNLDHEVPSESPDKDIPEKNVKTSENSSECQSKSSPLSGLEHELPSKLSNNGEINETPVTSSSNTSNEPKSIELSCSKSELPLESSYENSRGNTHMLCSSNNENKNESSDVSQLKSPLSSSTVEDKLSSDCSNKGNTKETCNTKPDSELKLVCFYKNARNETSLSPEIERQDSEKTISESKSKSAYIPGESYSNDVSNVESDLLQVCSDNNGLLKEARTPSEDCFASDFNNSARTEHSSNSNELDKNIMPERDVHSVALEMSNSETEPTCDFSYKLADQVPEKDVHSVALEMSNSETEPTCDFSNKLADQVTFKIDASTDDAKITLQTDSKTSIDSKIENEMVNKIENVISAEGKTHISLVSEICSLKETISNLTAHTDEHTNDICENSEMDIVNVKNETKPVISSIIKLELSDAVSDNRDSTKITANSDEKSVELQIDINVEDETNLSLTKPVISSIVKSEELSDAISDNTDLTKITPNGGEESAESQIDIKQTVSGLENSSTLTHSIDIDSSLVADAVEIKNSPRNESDGNIQLQNEKIEVIIENTFADKIDRNIQNLTDNDSPTENNINCEKCLGNKLCFCTKKNLSTDVTPERVVSRTLVENDAKEPSDNEVKTIKDSVIPSTIKSNEINISYSSTLTNNDSEQVENDESKSEIISNNLNVTPKSFCLNNCVKFANGIIVHNDNCCKENTEKCPIKSTLENTDICPVKSTLSVSPSSGVPPPDKEFVPNFCEKQNEYEAFSDISPKNKDKSINVDSGSKDTNPLTKFSCAASTEIFSMYRNVMLHNENFESSVPRDVTPDKGDVFFVTDDIKSYSSDHSDEESKHSSEEETKVLSEDVKITSESLDSLENDDSSLSKKSEVHSENGDSSLSKKNVHSENDDSSLSKTNDVHSENDDASLSKKNGVTVDKNESEVVDKNDASCSPVGDLKLDDDVNSKRDLKEEPVKTPPRQSVRLQSKIESQRKNNSGENLITDTSKTQTTSLQCDDTFSNDKQCFKIDYSGPDSHSISKNSNEYPCKSESKKSAADHRSVDEKDPSVTKSIPKDKSKDFNTPSKRYSLRKSSRRKEDSAVLELDLNKLAIASPTSCRSSSKRKVSAYVRALTSVCNSNTDTDTDSKQSVIHETRSSTAQSEKESKQEAPSYNLRNRKSILTPARLRNRKSIQTPARLKL